MSESNKPKSYKKWKILILSVENSERRKHVENLKMVLENHQIETEIIDAYYYKTTDVVEKLLSFGIMYDSPTLTLSQSQIGCFLSHREAWRKIQSAPDNESETLHIILEDDMDLMDPDNFNIYYLLEDIQQLQNFDGLILWKHPRQLFENDPKNITENLQEFYYQWGLCAYCVTKPAASKLLEINRFYQPVDEMVFKDIFPSLNVFYVKNQHFMNMGGLTSDSKYGTQFKSLIWT